MATSAAYIDLDEGSAPSAPASGKRRVYAKTDGIYEKDDADTEAGPIGSGGGGGGGTSNHALCQGRLTLETGVAVSTSDQSAKATLYFTPFHGNLIGTYTDAAWQLQSFTEKSLSLSGYTADKNYDIWIEDSDLSLSSTVWTNDTTRATALAKQDGVYVKTGDVSKRYLGTIRINAAGGQSEDTKTQRYVWNVHNRKRRFLVAVDGTDSWTYGTATWRAANGSTTNHQLRYVAGVSEDIVDCDVRAGASVASGVAGSVGIGLDSTSANSAQTINEMSAGTTVAALHTAVYRGYPGIGYHALNWIEYVRAGTMTFKGDDGVADMQSGIHAIVEG